jgi:D-alanine-D-alanine ligase and related ATP-grasp enzymes
MDKKLRIAVLFGGRSGEHEVSLMSAKSVVSALDPDKYEITQIGISKDGVWLTGKNILEEMSKDQIENKDLNQVVIIPDQYHNRIWEIQNIKSRVFSQLQMWTWYSPFCMAHLAKMAQSKGCSNWQTWHMWVQV